MCGHVGAAGDIRSKDLDAIRDLIWAGAVRGYHSTGMAFYNRHSKKVKVVKRPGPPLYLVIEPEFKNNLTLMHDAFIGHNRHATVGEKTEANAHPFDFSNIVGAHNGTLEYRARKALEDNEKFGTDSEALFHNINHLGVVDVMSEMSGAWALVWIDKRNNTINFLRNDQRPLSYTFSKDGKVCYWASEPRMLRWILSRNAIDYGDVYSPTPDQWISFTIPKTGQVFGEPMLTEAKGWTRPPLAHGRTPPWEPDGEDMWEIPFMGYDRQHVLNLGPAAIGPGRKEAENKNLPGLPAGTPSPKNDSEKKQSVIAGELDSRRNMAGQTTKSRSTNECTGEQKDNAYQDGWVAGEEGKSRSFNPFPPNTRLFDAWNQGRFAGLELATQRRRRNAAEAKSLGEDIGADPFVGQRIKGFNGELIGEKEFKDRTEMVCSWGGCDVEFGDPVRWISRDTCVCEDCTKGTKLMKELFGKAA